MQLVTAAPPALHIRRLAFELGLSDLRVQGALIARSTPYAFPRLAVCPCCGYPTIYKRAFFDICQLCGWEDDGQDDPRAGEVFGGPNSDYSLAEARHNFAVHGTQYRPSDEERFEREARTRDARAQLARAFDALLPVVKPWEFISALPEIERLDRRIHDLTFGKKVRSIQPRDPSAVKRQQQYRDWDVWTTLAARTLPPWRNNLFTQPPPLEREKDRAFTAFSADVEARVNAIAAERGTVAPERVKFFSRCTEWMRDERAATLSQFLGYESIGLTFWPEANDAKRVYYRFDDPNAVEDAANRIVRYFVGAQLRAVPDP